MSEVSIDLKAKDAMSSVLDHVTQRLGVFSKAGIGMGIAFAGINIAVGMMQQAFQAVIGYLQDGVEANRKFEMSMARLSVSSTDFNTSLGSLKTTLKNFSVMFATDLNTLSDGLQTFIQQGYSASESVTLLWHAQRLAIVSGDDLATTTDVLDRAFKAFRLDASDVTDVTNKLNGIMSITHMTLGEIDTILGRVAIAAQTSGISFSSLIDLMYTLHETGTSNRFLASELEKQLQDLSKVKINPMPDSTATSIETKFKKITSTVQFTSDMMKQLGAISQMDLTGGLDLSVMFDKNTIASAKEFFDTLNTKGITTLEKLNEELLNNKDNYLVWSDIPIAENPGLLQLIRSMYQYNDMADAAGNSTETWQDKLQVLRDTINTFNVTLATQTATLATVSQTIGDLTEMRTYTIDMRNATLAVQAHQKAIEGLQRISDQYALSQMKNSLAIMKIQYNADARHGLDRTQKEQIAALEKLNAGIQIKEQENQIAIGEIRSNGLQDAQDRLDEIRTKHDSAMFEQQIRDLDANIKTQNELYSSTLTAIALTNTQKTALMKEWYAGELTAVQEWAKKYNLYLPVSLRSTGASTPNATKTIGTATPPGTMGPPAPPGYGGHAPIWKYQHGGIVQETAAALVHKGELILPKNMVDSMRGNNNVPISNSNNGGSVSQNINITVTAELHKDVDVEDWGKKLGAGLASGFLSGSSSGTTTATSRKTGSTIVVPGTSITTALGLRAGRAGTGVTTVPVAQPIQNKGRFRRG